MEYISPEELDVCIAYLKSKPEIKKEPKPQYPLEALLCLSILEPDPDYLVNIASIDPSLSPEDMTIDQVRTLLTLIESLENEQPGVLAANIENGFLLRLIGRIKELMR